jgi:hypothetical protein
MQDSEPPSPLSPPPEIGPVRCPFDKDCQLIPVDRAQLLFQCITETPAERCSHSVQFGDASYCAVLLIRGVTTAHD